MRRFIQYIYVFWSLLWFAILMLVAIPFVLISLLFGRKTSGDIIYRICNIWGKIWYLLAGIKHEEIYEVPHNHNKQYVFVANHISYMDIPPIFLSIHQPVRILGKLEMAKFPLFGLIYRAITIPVDRSSPEHRVKSVKALIKTLKNGTSIFIFPEGTFNETGNPLKSFYNGAFRIALETQTNIKPLLFIDSHERMHYKSFFDLTPGKNRVVFLDEIDVSGYEKKDMQLLRQEVFEKMEKALRRYRNYETLR